jgi:hypothetical protein
MNVWDKNLEKEWIKQKPVKPQGKNEVWGSVWQRGAGSNLHQIAAA